MMKLLEMMQNKLPLNFLIIESEGIESKLSKHKWICYNLCQFVYQ
jgi:hypothetical protein